MRKRKNHILIALMVVSLFVFFNVTSVHAENGNGMMSKIADFQNQISLMLQKIGFISDDVSGIKDTVLKQQNQIEQLREIVQVQQNEILQLKKAVSQLQDPTNPGDNDGNYDGPLVVNGVVDNKFISNGELWIKITLSNNTSRAFKVANQYTFNSITRGDMFELTLDEKGVVIAAKIITNLPTDNLAMVIDKFYRDGAYYAMVDIRGTAYNYKIDSATYTTIYEDNLYSYSLDGTSIRFTDAGIIFESGSVDDIDAASMSVQIGNAGYQIDSYTYIYDLTGDDPVWIDINKMSAGDNIRYSVVQDDPARAEVIKVLLIEE